MEKNINFYTFDEPLEQLKHLVIVASIENDHVNNFIINLSLGSMMPFSHIFSYMDRINVSGFNQISLDSFLAIISDYQIDSIKYDEIKCQVICSQINELIIKSKKM